MKDLSLLIVLTVLSGFSTSAQQTAPYELCLGAGYRALPGRNMILFEEGAGPYDSDMTFTLYRKGIVGVDIHFEKTNWFPHAALGYGYWQTDHEWTHPSGSGSVDVSTTLQTYDVQLGGGYDLSTGDLHLQPIAFFTWYFSATERSIGTSSDQGNVSPIDETYTSSRNITADLLLRLSYDISLGQNNGKLAPYAELGCWLGRTTEQPEEIGGRPYVGVGLMWLIGGDGK